MPSRAATRRSVFAGVRGARRWSLPLNLPLYALVPRSDAGPATFAATDRSRIEPARISNEPVPEAPSSWVPDSRVMDPPLPALLKSIPATVRREPARVMRSPRAARWIEPPVSPEASMLPVTVMLPRSALRRKSREVAVPLTRTSPVRTRIVCASVSFAARSVELSAAREGSDRTSRVKLPFRPALPDASMLPFSTNEPSGVMTESAPPSACEERSSLEAAPSTTSPEFAARTMFPARVVRVTSWKLRDVPETSSKPPTARFPEVARRVSDPLGREMAVSTFTRRPVTVSDEPSPETSGPVEARSGLSSETKPPAPRLRIAPADPARTGVLAVRFPWTVRPPVPSPMMPREASSRTDE